MDFVYAKMIRNAGISSKYTVAVGLFKMLDKSLINSYFTQFCAGGVLVSIPDFHSVYYYAEILCGSESQAAL